MPYFVAHRTMGAALLPGGLLLEATTDREGAVAVAHLLRRHDAGLSREGLLFATDFHAGFAPAMFGRYLPRDLQPGRRPLPLAMRRCLRGMPPVLRSPSGRVPHQLQIHRRRIGMQVDL